MVRALPPRTPRPAQFQPEFKNKMLCKTRFSRFTNRCLVEVTGCGLWYVGVVGVHGMKLALPACEAVQGIKLTLPARQLDGEVRIGMAWGGGAGHLLVNLE